MWHKLTSSRAFNSRWSCCSLFSLVSLGSLARPSCPRNRDCDCDCWSIPCHVTSLVYDWLALIAKFSCNHTDNNSLCSAGYNTHQNMNSSKIYLTFFLCLCLHSVMFWCITVNSFHTQAIRLMAWFCQWHNGDRRHDCRLLLIQWSYQYTIIIQSLYVLQFLNCPLFNDV